MTIFDSSQWPEYLPIPGVVCSFLPSTDTIHSSAFPAFPGNSLEMTHQNQQHDKTNNTTKPTTRQNQLPLRRHKGHPVLKGKEGTAITIARYHHRTLALSYTKGSALTVNVTLNSRSDAAVAEGMRYEQSFGLKGNI